MPLAIRAVPASKILSTPFGNIEVDVSSPRILRARAGHAVDMPVLRDATDAFAIDMAFGWNGPTGRFGLLAENGRMIWNPSSPEEKPGKDWYVVAKAVDEAVRTLIAEQPDLSSQARTENAEEALGLHHGTTLNPAIVSMRRALLRMVG